MKLYILLTMLFLNVATFGQKKTNVTKILTLTNPTFYWGDLPHLEFKDVATNKVDEYEAISQLAAITEIEKKCEDHVGCPALKNQKYQATLKYKLMDVMEYDANDGENKKTGKKEKRWVIVAIKKI